MKKTWTAVAAALAVATCSSVGNEMEMLKNQLSEAQTVTKLSAENTKRLEDTCSDIHFELNSLTVANFKTKVATGDTFYAYIGHSDCGDCNVFEPTFKRYIEKHRPGNEIYFVNMYRLHQDEEAWMTLRQQYKLSGTSVLAKYSKGRQVSRLDLENSGGSTSATDLEKRLALNKL